MATVKTVAEEAKHAAQQAKVNNDLYEDLEMIKDKIRETTDAISKTAHDVRGKTSEMLLHSAHEVKARTVNLEENLVAYVKENPWRAIGISALSGFLLALILRR